MHVCILVCVYARAYVPGAYVCVADRGVCLCSADAYSPEPEPLCDFSQPLLSELIRDSGCYDVWRLSEEAPAEDSTPRGPSSEDSPRQRPSSPHAAAASDPAGAEESCEDTASTEPASGPECRPEQEQGEGEDRRDAEEERSAEMCSDEDGVPVPATAESESEVDLGRAELTEADRGVAEEVRETAAESAELVRAQPATVAPLEPDTQRRASPQRAAVDFERKFESARSVFEPNCVRRQIPVGVRGRTQLGADAEPGPVGEEVTV